MASSTIPALKAALLARLQADAALAGVQVSWGIPFGELARECVILGDARAEDATGGRPGGQSTVAIGTRAREERYLLELLVRVLKGASQQEVTERAFALAAAVEDSLRAWAGEAPPFGGVVRWALVTGTPLEEFPAANGERMAIVTVEVAAAERI